MRKLPIFPALLLILAMFAVAEHCGQKEIIFPEIAALALGAWIMEKPPWRSAPIHFWLSPTLAALTGVLLVRYFEYSPFLMIIAAFCLVTVQLNLFRSAVLPSISAAILAIITRSDSWYYPLSVCLMAGAIAAGRALLERSGRGNGRESGPGTEDAGAAGGRENLSTAMHWGKLLAGVMVVSGIAVFSGHLFMVAPPLIVAFVELSGPGGASREKMLKVLALLWFAAVSGTSWFGLIHVAAGLPLWLTAAVSTLTVFLAYHVVRLPFPPAVAIALLPTIVPQESLWMYPWQVLAGSVAFVAISRLCFEQGERAAVVKESFLE